MTLTQKVLQNLVLVGALTITNSFSHAQNNAPSNAPGQGDMHVGPIINPPQHAPSFTLALSAGLRNETITEFRAGSPVWVTVRRTNITNHTIDDSGFYSDAGDMSNFWDVRDEDGKPVEKIVHQHPELDTGSPFWSGIGAGKTDTEEVELDRAYKLDKPGKYVIRVSRRDPDFKDTSGTPVMIKSNTITITIGELAAH